MTHRGRRSADELATPNVDGEPPRLDPPPNLTTDERSLFVEIVEACSPKHFVPSDLPLLVSFIQSTLLSRQAIKNAAKDGAALAVWEKATRMQATLATRIKAGTACPPLSKNLGAPAAKFDSATVGKVSDSELRPGEWSLR
jgi:hypothetical protein